MAVLPEQASCLDDEENDLCRIVDELTGNEQAAELTDWLVAKPLAIVGLIVGGIVVRWLLHRVIDRITHRAAEGTIPGVLQRGKGQKLLENAGPSLERREQRSRTMGSLLKSIATGVVFTVVAFMVIAEVGYDIGPLIASAGIVGIALGFGAQSLVADFLSGVFLILEDQYGVGDVVDLGEATGVVEAVGLRVTRLRDVNGTVWYVRNGEIIRVGNQSQHWARTVLDIPVAYSENLDRIREILGETAHGLFEDEEYSSLILEEPEVWGVERWDPDGVIVRVVLKTAPLEQWNVARELRERIKERFDELGIEIPLPQRVLWMRSGDGEGAGPAAPPGPGQPPARPADEGAPRDTGA